MEDEVDNTQEMNELCDKYMHRILDRRNFVGQMTKLAGGVAAAYSIIPLIGLNQAQAVMVDEFDVRLVSQRLNFMGATGSMFGYLVQPADKSGRLPTVVVVHENEGLNEYIKDVARRLALENFIVFAPDFLSPVGTPDDPDDARSAINKLDLSTTIQSGVAAVSRLKYQRDVHVRPNGKVGALGFGWGGGLVNRIAANTNELDAAVVFYGSVPKSVDIPNISANMLLHYGILDKSVKQSIPEVKAALKSAGIDYTIHMYEGANYSFHNDTSPAQYDEQSAELAWSRTIDFLKRTLA